jgi:hypothetical protein
MPRRRSRSFADHRHERLDSGTPATSGVLSSAAASIRSCGNLRSGAIRRYQSPARHNVPGHRNGSWCWRAGTSVRRLSSMNWTRSMPVCRAPREKGIGASDASLSWPLHQGGFILARWPKIQPQNTSRPPASGSRSAAWRLPFLVRSAPTRLGRARAGSKWLSALPEPDSSSIARAAGGKDHFSSTAICSTEMLPSERCRGPIAWFWPRALQPTPRAGSAP